MAPLTWAYLALAVGLMAHGALQVGLGLRRSSRPAGPAARAALWLALVAALAGVVAAVILEARAARPW